jgi:L-alanine-DL-glutamate epimerase-like enolase superfamily enzyme
MRALDRFELLRFEVPSDRPVGDWRITADRLSLAALRLFDRDGREGLGFALSLAVPLPDAATCAAAIEAIWPRLCGRQPVECLHALPPPARHRGPGLPHNLDNALDQALWDLAAKQADLPLYRYLGGTGDGIAPAYASGLCFPLDDRALHAFYAAARAAGHGRYKVKVGHADLARDIERLHIARDAVGPDARFMIDANEAWTLPQARHALDRIAAAGFDLLWVEDPLRRDDLAGLADLRRTGGGVPVNAGEYLDSAGRMALLRERAADIININDLIGEGAHFAWAAAQVDVPVTLGNTIANIGAHLAAALPAPVLTEDANLAWNELVVRPIPIIDGAFVLPDAPGHGLALAPHAIARFGVR